MRRHLDIHFALCAASTLGFAPPSLAAETCDTLLPGRQGAAPRLPLDEDMLARMRDAGPIYHYQTDRPILSLSPDKDRIAFEIHQGDPSDDSYCVGIAVLPLRQGAKADLVDVGRELILDPHPAKNWAAYETGVSLPITPRWSPDGDWLAFLKRVNGKTQVWRAEFGNRSSRQLTHSGLEVDDFRIAADGRTLVYAARPNLAANEAAIEREGLRGWRIDARVLPARGPRPMTPNAATVYRSLDIATGAERPAAAEQAALFGPPAPIPRTAVVYAKGPLGGFAWIEAVEGSGYPARYDLVVMTASGQRKACAASVCGPDRLSRMWWTDDEARLRFTRREGWAGSKTAIYEWKPGGGQPARIYQTRDHLVECQPTGNDLLCFRDRSSEPRHIVLLGLGGRPEKTLFRTNPEFAKLTLGRAERKEWRSALGVPFYADLVYPAGYKAGRRYPMVVVQYRTRGFLRGGVGDEMPIQAFANRGYFVLVFDIGDEAAMVGPRSSETEQQVSLNRDHMGLKHVLSGLETITGSLIDNGLVDRERIGIHGLSAGATTVQFAAINSTLFSAGSLSGCCWEADQDAYLGQTIAEAYHTQGWPRLSDPAPAFWSQLSLMQHPDRVRFPILLQVADREFVGSLGAFTALTQAGVPADAYVFPDEYHLKWHPAHRLAIYRRNLAWFDFWLKNIIPEDPPLEIEAKRWRAMREKWQVSRSKTRAEPGQGVSEGLR
jgi:dipeptidyl aminopeptidase/acylaminoacyl peptidase